MKKNILIILCSPKLNSFNHAIAQVVATEFEANGHQVVFHDLYAENFDPILTQDEIDLKKTDDLPPSIRQSCDELIKADIIVIIHPNWWGQPPALLKGWLDRVVRDGVAFRFTEKGAQGLLKAQKVYIFNTSNTPENVELESYGDPLENLWKNCIFGMCGISNFERIMFKGVITSTPDMRKEWLNQITESLHSIS